MSEQMVKPAKKRGEAKAKKDKICGRNIRDVRRAIITMTSVKTLKMETI